MDRPPKEPPDGESLIPPHGGYRNLKSFQMAELCFDVTVRFCKRYVERRSRTHDQMVQAARSGTQNIADKQDIVDRPEKAAPIFPPANRPMLKSPRTLLSCLSRWP